jgi:hypothetical protein
VSRNVDFAQLYPVIALVCDALDRLRVTYLVCGSVATYFHGNRTRETHDVDLLADVRPRPVARLSGALSASFLNADTSAINDALDLANVWRGGGRTVNLPSINLTYQPIATPHADIFLPVGEPHSVEARWEREQFKNRVRERGPDQRAIWVAGVEDTLIAKTRWYALGHGESDLQWRDLQALLLEHRQRLNRRYLEYWTAELGIADAWDAVWRGQRPPPDEDAEQLRLF